MDGHLTATQVETYRQRGFYFPVELMSKSEATRHLAALQAAEADNGPMHYRVKPYLLMTSAWKIATSPRLLDAVESVLGPDILLWDCSYIIKEPHNDSFVSWHQDLTYWGLQMETDDDLVSAWVALTPAMQANGAMQFVRGSQAAGTFAHVDTYADHNILHRGQAISANFEPSTIVQSELAPGQASLHHGWTVHSSGPNATASRRVGIVMNYLKPSVRQVVGDVESATLVRGEDRFCHFKTEPVCETDFAPGNVAFQQDMERRKRDVYDSA